jgi:hypothetical protein
MADLLGALPDLRAAAHVPPAFFPNATLHKNAGKMPALRIPAVHELRWDEYSMSEK